MDDETISQDTNGDNFVPSSDALETSLLCAGCILGLFCSINIGQIQFKYYTEFFPSACSLQVYIFICLVIQDTLVVFLFGWKLGIREFSTKSHFKSELNSDQLVAYLTALTLLYKKHPLYYSLTTFLRDARSTFLSQHSMLCSCWTGLSSLVSLL